MTSCVEVRHALGVYVLGAIDPAERADVEAHLAACAACRDELASFAGLPALLSRVTPDEVEHVPDRPEPGPELLDRTLARVSAERRRSRRLRLASAAAAVLLVGGLSGGLGTSLAESAGAPAARPTSAPAPATRTFSSTDPRSNVSATVALRPEVWGSELVTRVSGVPPNMACRLVVVSGHGTRDVAASWRATYRGTALVTGATRMPRRDIARFEIVTTAGHTLVTVPVSGTAS